MVIFLVGTVTGKLGRVNQVKMFTLINSLNQQQKLRGNSYCKFRSGVYGMDFGPESRNALGGISKWGESVAVWKYKGGGLYFCTVAACICAVTVTTWVGKRYLVYFRFRRK